MAFREYGRGVAAGRLWIAEWTLEFTGEVCPDGGKEREKGKLTVPEGKKSP